MRIRPKLLVVVLYLALVLFGSSCKVAQRGPSDRELLGELLRTYEEALAVGDAEKLLGLYSEDYVSPDGTDYEEAASRLRRILPALHVWDVKILTADTAIEIEGNGARLSPVIIESGRGQTILTMTAAKAADGVWRITSTETE